MRPSIELVFNEQPVKVFADVHCNATTVIITVGEGEITPENRHFRLRGGVSLCHADDKYDFLTGVKVACRRALGIGQPSWDKSEERIKFERALYSAIRRSIRHATEER